MYQTNDDNNIFFEIEMNNIGEASAYEQNFKSLCIWQATSPRRLHFYSPKKGRTAPSSLDTPPPSHLPPTLFNIPRPLLQPSLSSLALFSVLFSFLFHLQVLISEIAVSSVKDDHVERKSIPASPHSPMSNTISNLSIIEGNANCVVA